jgi:hypothetical protein
MSATLPCSIAACNSWQGRWQSWCLELCRSLFWTTSYFIRPQRLVT